ncbi:MAG: hypothetical protein ACMXYG_05820 [Candidatus Woesearchaeota archaeon]
MKKSQINMELLILLGIIMIVMLTIVFFTIQPSDEINKNRAFGSLTLLSEYANQVADLGPGNTVRFKLEIPSGVRSIDYTESGITMFFQDDIVSIPLKMPLSGSLSGEISPGVYDVVVTSYGTYLCAYFPYQSPNDVCPCDKPFLLNFSDYDSSFLVCGINGVEDECDNNSNPIEYDTIITSLKAACENEDRDQLRGKMVFSIINRKGEIIYENTMFDPDGALIYNLENLNYAVNYSGPLTFQASCVSACYNYGLNSPENDLYINTTNITVDIPYGTLIPFLIDRDGNFIYTDTNYLYLVNPFPDPRFHYQTGRVQESDIFIVRTGYRCIGGECINIDAGLWHSDYYYEK